MAANVDEALLVNPLLTACCVDCFLTGQGPAELFNKNKFQKEKKMGVMTSAVPS